MLLGDETKWRLIESDGGKGPMEAKKKKKEKKKKQFRLATSLALVR